MLRTILLTLLSLLAFAGNSVLCRLALIDGAIDPLGFTLVRLLSGAISLFLLIGLSKSKSAPNQSTETGSWLAGGSLFCYAILFSYAYVSLDTATGALILFGSVQIAIVVFNMIVGAKLKVVEVLGVIVASLGLVYLVYPELSTPSARGLLMMSLSGIGWAAYTVLGKGAQDALQTTAYNFLRSTPMIFGLLLILYSELSMSSRGVYLAIASGAVTSGLGYAIWYAGLKGLSSTQAGVAMLSVPIIAGIGGVIFANELITLRLVIASIVIIGGITIVIFSSKLSARGF